MYACVCVCASVCMCSLIFVRIYFVRVYVYVYVCVCACVRVLECVCVRALLSKFAHVSVTRCIIQMSLYRRPRFFREASDSSDPTLD